MGHNKGLIKLVNYGKFGLRILITGAGIDYPLALKKPNRQGCASLKTVPFAMICPILSGNSNINSFPNN
jgi:hypothetical protein